MRQFFSILVLVLLINSAVAVSGQRSSRRVKRNRPASTNSAAVRPSGSSRDSDIAKSPSGKLLVGGTHADLVGILEIETDLSLEGPLMIEVSSGGVAVPQREGDKTGRLEVPLTRKKQYKVPLKLANGLTVIEIKDAVERDEEVIIKWTGSGTEPVVTTLAETPPVVKKSASPLVSSESGKLSVNAVHTDEQAVLDVSVGDLVGPFTVKVLDAAKNVVITRKKQLDRGDTSFNETISLKSGKFTITVASEDGKETAENVTLGPWSFKGSPVAYEELPKTFAPNDFEKSDKGNLAAAVTRIDGVVNLKVHISDDLKGFKVKVLDAKEKEVDSRSFADLPRHVNDWSLRLKTAEGENVIKVSAVDDSESVVLKIPAAALLKPAAEPPVNPQEAVEYDWGRVRGYFTAGMIFSKERDDFSHSDMFLDFTLDKNYVARPFFKIWPDSTDKNGDVRHHYLFKDFNTFFNARLTSIPVAAKETTPTDGGTGAGEEECNTPDCNTFITSKKAAMMQAGIYLPMYWGFTTWYRRVQRDEGKFRWEKNALFVSPLAKGGIITVTGDRETAEAQQFGHDDVFNFYSFGAMLGHYRLHARRKLDDYGRPLLYNTGRPVYEANPNIAPELISWLTLSMGRWENFEIEVPTGQKDAMGNDIKVRQRPWRFEALGRLKIPEMPVIIGFDGNFGKGPDDLRFIFGTRFDIGKIMHTLKLAGAQDSVGRSAPPPPADNTP